MPASSSSSSDKKKKKHQQMVMPQMVVQQPVSQPMIVQPMQPMMQPMQPVPVHHPSPKKKKSSSSSDKTAKQAEKAMKKCCGLRQRVAVPLFICAGFCCCFIIIIILVAVFGEAVKCSNPRCTKVTEEPKELFKSCKEDCDCPGAMTCGLFDLCAGELTTATCTDYGQSNWIKAAPKCNPNESRLTKCTKGQDEQDGPQGAYSCKDDCGCGGGRWCSQFGWC